MNIAYWLAAMNNHPPSRGSWAPKPAAGHPTIPVVIRIRAIFALVLLTAALAGVARGQEATFAIGDTVRVATAGQRLNLRAEPALNSAVVIPLENGTVLQVVDGPRTADGYTWWKLSGEPGEGWAVATFLEAVDSDGSPPRVVRATDTSFPIPVSGESIADVPRIASSYGFSGFCFLGWRWPTLDDSLPLKFDAIRTYNDVENAAALLNRAGYASTAYENNRAAEAVSRLPQDEVFFFYGHGDNRFLVFHDRDCNYSLLPAPDLQQVSASELRLTVLLGCNTGANLSAPDNVMRAFQDVGSDKVIGFNTEIQEFRANHWNTLFWQYAANDGLEVGDAAQKAINDTIYDMPWLAPGTLEILGEEDVYLVTAPVPAEAALADLVARLRAWLEAEQATLAELPVRLRTWLEEQWAELETRIKESVHQWLQQEAEQFLVRLLQAIERLLAEICLAPIVSALLLGGVSFRAYRRRQARVSAKE